MRCFAVSHGAVHCLASYKHMILYVACCIRCSTAGNAAHPVCRNFKEPEGVASRWYCTYRVVAWMTLHLSSLQTRQHACVLTALYRQNTVASSFFYYD